MTIMFIVITKSYLILFFKSFSISDLTVVMNFCMSKPAFSRIVSLIFEVTDDVTSCVASFSLPSLIYVALFLTLSSIIDLFLGV